MKTINKKVLYILAIIVFFIVISVIYLILSKQLSQKPISNTNPSATTAATISNQTDNSPETKIYLNTEWGFEFQYPQDLILKENTFKSYYSKFNLTLFTPIREKRDLTFDVNIVLPEFPERSFKNIEKIISEIIVAGVPGVKYEYEFEGFPETAIILPFGEYKMILGTGGGSKQYLEEFNQILASFKFLK